jgi:Lrp/AsnC family transcriptional regulator for asnA, asnC and gidA
MASEIDAVDRKILEMLQDDARIAFRKIAEEAGVSEATVFVRVRKLLEKGVIRRFTALVAPEKMGTNLTAFVLINADPKKLQTVLDALSSMSAVYEVYDVTGTYYAIAKIRTQNREKLAKIIDQIGMIEGVASTETAIVLRAIKEETRIKT